MQVETLHMGRSDRAVQIIAMRQLRNTGFSEYYDTPVTWIATA